MKVPKESCFYQELSICHTSIPENMPKYMKNQLLFHKLFVHNVANLYRAKLKKLQVKVARKLKVFMKIIGPPASAGRVL